MTPAPGQRYLAVGPTWDQWQASQAERAGAPTQLRPPHRGAVSAALLRFVSALDDAQPPCASSAADFHPSTVEDAGPAVAVCWRCPAREPCAALADALDERHGVWGATWRGNSRADRRRVPLSDPTTTTEETP